MNFESNAAKTIAALVVLNAALFVSHHVPAQRLYTPAVQASIASNNVEMCKAKAEMRIAAHQAAMEARAQAREAARQAKRARRDMKQAAAMAPSASQAKARTTITEYVRCIVSSGVRTIVGGI